MKNNICGRCKKEPKRNASSSYCKFCHNEYQKKYHKEFPKAIKDSKDRRRVAIRKLVVDSKNKPCTDCGIKYPYYVMDFDHLRDKKFDLSRATSHLWSPETVKKEIDKCEVVCSNCHRVRTFKKFGESTKGR